VGANGGLCSGGVLSGQLWRVHGGFLWVTAFCLAWLLAFPGTTLINKANFEVLIFFAFWLAYSLFSYIWAIDRDLALENSLLIFRYLGVFVIFDALFRDHRILGARIWSWPESWCSTS
jgi:hypothetical protein